MFIKNSHNKKSYIIKVYDQKFTKNHLENLFMVQHY